MAGRARVRGTERRREIRARDAEAVVAPRVDPHVDPHRHVAAEAARPLAAGPVVVMTRGTTLIGSPGRFFATSGHLSAGSLENSLGSAIGRVHGPFIRSLVVSQELPSSR